jgi:hypothetical protein
MQKDLYLHLGLHKTSSTSFQATCKANLQFLLDQGITYPLFKCAQISREDISNHSIPLFSLFSGKADRYHINIRIGINDVAAANSEYLTQLDQILANSNKVILSGEDIGVFNANAFNQLKAAISKHNYTIKPFALVRDPYSFMNSAFQQMIKSGNYNSLISLGALTESKANAGSIIPNRNQAIKTIIDSFGDSVRFYPFSKACEYNGGPVHFILEHICGVQDMSSITLCRKNQSRSNLWTRIQNQLNKSNPALINNETNPNHRALAKNLFTKNAQKFNLTETEFTLIQDQYKLAEDTMHALLGDEYMSNSYTFSDPISADVLANLITDYATLITTS